MIKIAVCISTRRRQEGLNKLLESINKLIIPSDTELRIIIVENDEEFRSSSIVGQFSVRSRFPVTYILETKQGLAYARNRSVKEAGEVDFCCFVDDDQIVAEDWLSELFKCHAEYNADGVWGSNPPVFSKDVPVWIRKFHQPDTFTYGTVVRKAFTNCLMLRKKLLDRLSGPFDTRLNFSGGEDSLLTLQFSGNGGIIRYNPRAIAWEVIPGGRTTLKYILGRTYRISNTEIMIKSITEEDFSVIKSASRLTLRFGYGLLIAIPYFIFGREEKLKGLIKITNALGGLAFIAGKRNQFYK